MKTIVAATDLSARSDLAVQRARQLARTHGARLVLLHVVDDDQPNDLVRVELDAAKNYLQHHLAGELTNSHVRCEAGDACDVIGQVAQEEAAGLVVLGAHRPKAIRQIFTGTTVERVIRGARIPVLMVRGPGDIDYGRPAVCIDLAGSSQLAAVKANQLGLLPHGALAVHAYPSLTRLQMSVAGVDEAKQTSAAAGERATILADLNVLLGSHDLSELGLLPNVVEGAVPGAITEWARAMDVDLLVVGTHNRRGLQRLLLGSVAQGLLAEASCDVFVVPLDE